MPELPEVETTVRGLNKKVLGRTFLNVWTDFGNIIKKPKSFEQFKKEIKGKKIKKVWRKGKNIIFELSENSSLLIHQKLTGHLLYGTWNMEDGTWEPETPGPLKEKINRYIHLMFYLDGGKMLALSDLRKFAKIELARTEEIQEELKALGPDPLRIDFKEFKKRFTAKKGKIKQVLMNQEVISGVGNVYSDEALFEAKVHPFKEISKLKENDLKRIFQALKKVLKKAIKAGGESFSDFRDLEGKKGGFDPFIKVYRREGENCLRCGTVIKRLKLAGRSAHFCPKCQTLC